LGDFFSAETALNYRHYAAIKSSIRKA